MTAPQGTPPGSPYQPGRPRHTAATLWLAAGVPVKAVSARVGHSNAHQTLKTYAHVLTDSDEKILASNASQFAGEPLPPAESSPSGGEWQPKGHQSEAA